MRTAPALLICSVALSACGSPVPATQAGSEAPEPVSDVLKVVCEGDRTRVETPFVRAFADGVHATFENPGGAHEFWVRAVSNPDDGNHGGWIPDSGDERWGWSDAPGEYFIGCYDKGEHPPYYEMDHRYARYEVVDVDGLWISWHVECENSETLEGERLIGADSIEDVEAWIRDRFEVRGGERVRPGYPETGWKGNPWVIQEGDRTLVSFHAMEDDVGWTVHRAEGCVG